MAPATLGSDDARVAASSGCGDALEHGGHALAAADAHRLEPVARFAALELRDIDLIELNEAFAVQVLAVLREWDLPDGLERVNVNGSGISLGHPVGATGARILATLLRELERREARYGLETMCIGGGQGMAAVFERVAAT